MAVKVKEINPVVSWISDPDAVKNILSYKAEYWKQGPYRKERQVYTKHLIGPKGVFLTGYLPRVMEFLERKNIEYTFTPQDYGVEVGKPKLNGITFREDQMEALSQMLKAGRGVWKAPTGSGKTLLICGLVKAYKTPALVLVPWSRDLLHQTAEELKKFFGDVGVVGNGTEEWGRPVTVAIINTFSKRLNKIKPDDYGLVVVDEAHHVSSFDGMYGKTLKKVMAPHRFGLTATPPAKAEASFALEGLLGKIVGETPYGDLEEKKILARPIVKVYKVPEQGWVSELRGKYADIYEYGVVKNRRRNLLVMQKARGLINEGLTTLVMVERIDHGHELMKLAETLMPGTFVFVHGETDSQIREEEKKYFEVQKRKGVIATRVWGEGINIRSMGAVVNAVGGRSEIQCIQRFGRGLRKTKKKNKVLLVDFADFNHKWFIRHSLYRIMKYLEEGWKIEQ